MRWKENLGKVKEFLPMERAKRRNRLSNKYFFVFGGGCHRKSATFLERNQDMSATAYIENRKLSDDTPLSFLTLGDLKDIVSDAVSEAIGKPHIYGHCIADIATHFGVSLPTAKRYKAQELAHLVEQKEGKRIFSIDLTEAEKVIRKRKK